MRVLFALPGLHRYDRGAEVAFVSLATELAKAGTDVTLIGAGDERPGAPYNFVHAGAIAREHFESFPKLPLFRSETMYEEASFAPGLLRHYRPSDYDVTVTCSYPYTNWILRRSSGGHRPAHIFVTQNGDWPAQSDSAEYRYFACDGMVCTNPDFYERNRERRRCTLIPNGIDPARFTSGPGDRPALGLPEDAFVVLMVSALIPSKRVADGIEAISRIPDAHLVVAGDGPLRDAIDEQAKAMLPNRFTRVSVPAAKMPALYRSADVFLHLSKEESFGNVFIEALACGLPIVGHDSSRLRWIIGDDEFLTDTSSADATAAAIGEARREPTVSRAARIERARRFAWTKVAASYREFFEAVIEARQNV